MNLTELLEVSLSRVRAHLTDPEKTVVIFTGFRTANSKKQNLKNNSAIIASLRAHHYGFFVVNGRYEEEGQAPSKEDSIFVVVPKEEGDALINLCHDLANHTKDDDGKLSPQDSIFVKDDGIAYLLYSDKRKHTLGKFNIGKLNDYYTELRNNKGANSFNYAFENVDDLHSPVGSSINGMLRGALIEKYKYKEPVEKRPQKSFKEWLNK